MNPNNWNIPDWLEKEVRERDQVCVNCGIEFTSAKDSKKTAASWEHIINDAKIITREKHCTLLLWVQRQQGAKTTLCMVANKVLPRKRHYARNGCANHQAGNFKWSVGAQQSAGVGRSKSRAPHSGALYRELFRT
jgi:hypothetical protein